MGILEEIWAGIGNFFEHVINFICDVICYQGGESPQGKSDDEFDMLTDYFTGDSDLVKRNIATLESYFDCWCSIDGFSSPSDFLNSCMAHTPEHGKIVVDARNKIDIFEDCLHTYADMNGKQREFPLNRIVLLYAIICYLRNKTAISEQDYAGRLRSINNLIQNSEDEVSDRIDRNRMPAVLRQTEAVMLTGSIDDTIENSFNVSQIAEEKEKKAFLEEHPGQAGLVYSLEDHPSLKGQISIVGLDHVDMAERFTSLFTCSWDLIDCALMSIGDYGQLERNKWRHQYASKSMQIAWDELFHRSANTGFEVTQGILVELLSKANLFSNELLQNIIDEFIETCEEESLYPWRYYYVKYSAFRPGSYGKYSNNDPEGKPYMYSVMQTKSQWSASTYMPYLKEADSKHLSRDSMGQRLVYGDVHIICTNNSFVLRDNATEEVIETVDIQQNDEGIDTEDRILVLKRYIDKLGGAQ